VSGNREGAETVMNNLSLKMKLGIGFGTLLLTLVAMGLLAYHSFGRLVDVSQRVDLIMAKKDMSSLIEASIEKQSAGIRGFLLVGREDLLLHDEEGKKEFAENMESLGKLLVTDEGKRLHAEIRRFYDEFRATADREIQLRRAGSDKEAAELAFNPQASATRTQLRQAVADMVALEDKLKGEAIKEQATDHSRSILMVVGLTVLGIVFGLLVAIVTTRSITGVISSMLSLIREIAHKNLDIEDMHVSGEDEIGQACTALNEMKNGLRDIIQQIADTAQRVASASQELSVTSQQISANSEETSAQAGTVSQATQHVSQNLQSVSKGAEEMTSTIQSIADNTHEAATVASSAVKTAQDANAIVAKLGVSSGEIGEVIKVITSIAQQTNLLALNATIEAARAGEAGKGFAVVANEVKELAKQTAKATEDISRKITAIQTDTYNAVEAIGAVSGVISQISDISVTIATAVEEQSATTNEMTRNVGDAAKGSGEITQHIEGVAEAARGTSASAQESQKAASELAEMAVQLHSLVGQFKLDESTEIGAISSAREPFKRMAAHAGR
jgi:methyl-accepting chemotaxis protein